jgi:hypothetical protein
MLTFSAVQDNDKIVGDLTKWLDPLGEVMCSPLGIEHGLRMACAMAWEMALRASWACVGCPHSYTSGKSLDCRPVLG